MTKAAQKFKAILSRYKGNPVSFSGTATAITLKDNEVAKPAKKKTRKKARTPAQIRATKKLVRLNKSRKKAKAKPRKTKPKKASARKAKKASTTRKRKTTTARKRASISAKQRRAVKAQATSSALGIAAMLEAQEKKKVAAKKRRKKTTTRRRTTKKRSTARRRAPAKRRRTTKKRRTTKRRAAPKRRTTGRRRSTRLKGTSRTVVVECKPSVKRKAPKRRRTTRRRRNPVEGMTVYQANPTLTGTLMGHSAYSGLASNPISPFSGKAVMGLVVTGAGIGLGFVVADITDRLVATRTPKDGNHPWYGQAAVAAQARRPDAYRLGIQGLGSVASLGLTYWTRGMPIVPWVTAGMSIAFMSNLFLKTLNWYVMPAIFKVEKPDEMTLGNRLFPTEQAAAQDQLDAMFENWQNIETLKLAQAEKPPGAVQGLLHGLAHSSSEDAAEKLGGALPLVATGHVGKCGSCGGQDGCYTTCPGLDDGCSTCGDDDLTTSDPTPGESKRCAYTVQTGDDLYKMANEAGVDINDVNALNSGLTPVDYWKEGSEVILPYELCLTVLRQPPPRKNIPEIPRTPEIPQIPEIPMDGGIVPQRPGVPGGGLVTTQRQPIPEGTVVLQRDPDGGPKLDLVPATPDVPAMPMAKKTYGSMSPAVVQGIEGKEEDADAAKERRLLSLGSADDD